MRHIPPGHDSAQALIDLVAVIRPGDDHAHAAGFETFETFLDDNSGRIGYAGLRLRGFQIGSGAMEALHPVASQARLKLPGARWLESTSRSIFALRMMGLVDRWDEFWEQPDLALRLAAVLSKAATA